MFPRQSALRKLSDGNISTSFIDDIQKWNPWMKLKYSDKNGGMWGRVIKIYGLMGGGRKIFDDQIGGSWIYYHGNFGYLWPPPPYSIENVSVGLSHNRDIAVQAISSSILPIFSIWLPGFKSWMDPTPCDINSSCWYVTDADSFVNKSCLV